MFEARARTDAGHPVGQHDDADNEEEEEEE